MSICESTPDVPANIIADPEVRATTCTRSMRIHSIRNSAFVEFN